MAAILGLFPNCAASVMITELYVAGVMAPGPMLSGLLVNAGVGLLVLFRVNKNRKENFAITGILFFSGVLLGTICGFFPLGTPVKIDKKFLYLIFLAWKLVAFRYHI